MSNLDKTIETMSDSWRETFAAVIRNQICFDALADKEGRCNHHGGKCYELGLLVNKLLGKDNV